MPYPGRAPYINAGPARWVVRVGLGLAAYCCTRRYCVATVIDSVTSHRRVAGRAVNCKSDLHGSFDGRTDAGCVFTCTVPVTHNYSAASKPPATAVVQPFRLHAELSSAKSRSGRGAPRSIHYFNNIQLSAAGKARTPGARPSRCNRIVVVVVVVVGGRWWRWLRLI